MSFPGCAILRSSPSTLSTIRRAVACPPRVGYTWGRAPSTSVLKYRNMEMEFVGGGPCFWTPRALSEANRSSSWKRPGPTRALLRYLTSRPFYEDQYAKDTVPHANRRSLCHTFTAAVVGREEGRVVNWRRLGCPARVARQRRAARTPTGSSQFRPQASFLPRS